jgi:hypothetical protein
MMTECRKGRVVVAGVMGLGILDGHVQAEIRMCSGMTAKSVTLEPAKTSAFHNPYPTWNLAPTNSGSVDLGPVNKFEALLGSKESYISSSSTANAVMTPIGRRLLADRVLSGRSQFRQFSRDGA